MQGPGWGGWKRELWGFLLLGALLVLCLARLPAPGEKGRGFVLYALALILAGVGCQAWAVYRRWSDGSAGPGGSDRAAKGQP